MLESEFDSTHPESLPTDVLLATASCLAETTKPGPVLEALERLCQPGEASDQVARALLVRGRIYEKQGDKERAAVEYQRVLSIFGREVQWGRIAGSLLEDIRGGAIEPWDVVGPGPFGPALKFLQQAVPSITTMPRLWVFLTACMVLWLPPMIVVAIVEVALRFRAVLLGETPGKTYVLMQHPWDGQTLAASLALALTPQFIVDPALLFFPWMSETWRGLWQAAVSAMFAALVALLVLRREKVSRVFKMPDTKLRVAVIAVVTAMLVQGGLWGIYLVIELLIKGDLVKYELPGVTGSGLVRGVYVGSGVLVAAVDEVLFRGMVFSSLKSRSNAVYAAIGSSVVFAACHLGFGRASSVASSLVLGLLACYLVERSRSLWPAIALHALENLVSLSIRAVK